LHDIAKLQVPELRFSNPDRRFGTAKPAGFLPHDTLPGKGWFISHSGFKV
jgi:hypothetical protein